MKLLFFPALLYCFLFKLIYKNAVPNVSLPLLSGILTGTTLIPVFFYTYSGILGFTVVWICLLYTSVGILMLSEIISANFAGTHSKTIANAPASSTAVSYTHLISGTGYAMIVKLLSSPLIYSFVI